MKFVVVLSTTLPKINDEPVSTGVHVVLISVNKDDRSPTRVQWFHHIILSGISSFDQVIS
jgi:hypothetical protein